MATNDRSFRLTLERAIGSLRIIAGEDEARPGETATALANGCADDLQALAEMLRNIAASGDRFPAFDPP